MVDNLLVGAMGVSNYGQLCSDLLLLMGLSYKPAEANNTPGRHGRGHSVRKK